MYQGRLYRRFGLNGHCIGFADRTREDEHTCRDGGIVTVTYAGEFSQAEKSGMARRILASMNLTSMFAVEDLEEIAPLPAPEFDRGLVDGRAFCRLPGPRNLIIGFEGRCPVSGIFGKNGGFAMVSYADEITHTEKEVMARRVLAAMNHSRFLPLNTLEQRCAALQLQDKLKHTLSSLE